MENNTPRAATQSQWEDLPKKIQLQKYKPVATITYSYNDFQNVWDNLNTSNYSSSHASATAFMPNFPWELSVDFNDLKNYLNITPYDEVPSSQQFSYIPLTFQFQDYYEYDGERAYGDPHFGNGSITFYNYPEVDDVQITIRPFGLSGGEGGASKTVEEDELVFIRHNNVSNLFSFTIDSTSYQLMPFPIRFDATPDFTNGVIAFGNTYNIEPYDLNIGSYNVTWRDLCEQVIRGEFPIICLTGDWATTTNTDTVQILEGRVLNRSSAGQGGSAIDLTTLISISPEGVNNMPNTYNMDCLATLRLYQNYALETISTKMLGTGGGGGSSSQVVKFVNVPNSVWNNGVDPNWFPYTASVSFAAPSATANTRVELINDNAFFAVTTPAFLTSANLNGGNIDVELAAWTPMETHEFQFGLTEMNIQ